MNKSIQRANNHISEAILNLGSLSWFHWKPGWDVLIALLTISYMIPSYYLMANDLHPLAIYNFLFVSLFVLVLFPAYYVLNIRRESLDMIGLTKRHWLLSLLISFALVLWLSPRLFGILSLIPAGLILPTTVFNGLCFWEPFFVFCWVQLRFERAFGVIPGILAAGLCLGSYHIGTYPMAMVVMLGMVGLIYAVLFRMTRNLLVLWPLTWATASTIGTVSGGYTFGWSTVWVYSVIIFIQVLCIWWITRTQNKNSEYNNSSSSNLKLARNSMNWREWILSCIVGSVLVYQVAFSFLNYNHMGLDNLTNVGWLVMTFSAIFGWMPIYTFRSKGGVPEGESYTHTTTLVDSGIYRILRHPQYFAGILISIATAFMSQHWLIIALIPPVVVGTYIDSLRADKRLIEKFGDEYKRYMERVSGLNPLIGIVALIEHRA
jgi:protein-S-isoprenylcysteine O-methyltransferase Ste14